MSNREKNLFEECRLGNFLNVKKLLAEGVNCNVEQSISVKDEYSTTELSSLCVAALEGYLEVVQILLKNGADVNYRCKSGESPLFLAARKGNTEVVKCLLAAGANTVYTAKPGEKILFENWEVFTQALRNAYPRSINHPSNAPYKAVVQLLFDYNASSQRPNTLYHALYCSLTLFANPIAIYCVGAYATLCSDQPSMQLTEEHFLTALCQAYDASRAVDFISSIHSILLSNKLRQKDVAQSLVKLFNWADLLCKLSEDLSRNNLSEMGLSLKQLMRIMQNLVLNFNVRSEIQNQLVVRNCDETGKIAWLIKYTLDQPQDGDYTDSETATWQFLFFLLKLHLRANQNAHVARLLLRPSFKHDSSRSSQSLCEFERKILLKCVEEDISLAHLLLDFGVSINGDCFVRFTQQGHLDLVNRCVDNKELLFCKEIDQLLKTPVSVRSASNRNMRKCIKIIKNQRNFLEEERSKIEEELLQDEFSSSKKAKKKRQRSRAKNHQPVTSPSTTESSVTLPPIVESSPHPSEDEPEPISLLDVGGQREKNIGKHDSTDCHLSNDENSDVTKGKRSKKKRNSKKNSGKSKNTATRSEPDSESENKNNANMNYSGQVNTPESWKMMMQTTSRRRRQSSSSSDCSTGPRKSVHFSHPLTFYENVKATGRSLQNRQPSNEVPKTSNLKRTVHFKSEYDLSETYRTNEQTGKPGELPCVSDYYANWAENEFDGNIKWKPLSLRWSARFEDLSEIEIDHLKQLHWGGNDENTVYFCDKQKHVHIGSGPDFSSVYLGLTDKGREVAMKKISCKRAPLLSQKEELEKLLNLGDHCHINKYFAIFRDRSHYYMLQTLGEYSLDQIIRRKMTSLPHSLPRSCLQVGKGLAYLHDNDILHMALKPSNIFLGVDGQLRLADYGSHCRDPTSTNKSTGPTPACMCWMAKEVLSVEENCGFTVKSDVASLGMVMFYILTGGSHPFGDPDTQPGVCVSNINRGAYNLKALTDPFAHHLVKNMVFNEVTKRFNIQQVVSHPYFWSDDDKDLFVSVLTETALAGGNTADGENILQKLASVESTIMNSYARKDNLLDVSEIYLSSIKGLLTFVYDCMHNYDLFDRHTNPEVKLTAPTPQKYFCLSFPGLLLHVYNIVTLDDLEKASVNCDVMATPPLTPDINFDDQCSNITMLIEGSECDIGLQSHHEYASSEDTADEVDIGAHLQDKSCAESKDADVFATHNGPLPYSAVSKTPSLKTQSDIFHTPSTTITYSSAIQDNQKTSQSSLSGNLATTNTPSAKDKKNTRLCLLSMQSNSNNNHAEKKKLDSNDQFLSPISAGENILLPGDWNENFQVNEVVHCAPNEKTTTPDGSADQISSSFRRKESTSSVVGSPDDWIEIGSPLEEVVPSIIKTAHLESNISSSYGDSPASSSSSCSVDECFDFGSYKDKLSGDWCEKPDFLKKNNNLEQTVHGDSVAVGGNSCWTDIDELD